MAEPSNARRAKVAGHFYYDWDLSKYRWTADAMDGNADAKNAKKAAFPNEVVKVNANRVGNHAKRKEANNEDLKKPLQDRDINQLLQNPEGNPVKKCVNIGPEFRAKQEKQHSGRDLETPDETLEITKGHKTMMTVLSARQLRLRAAQTLWHKDTNGFLEYILRLQDDSVIVDVMPFLTARIRDQSIQGQSLSMGACLEMLPALERLLSSRFEDYAIASLNMIREMVKRWWTQLKSVTSKKLNSSCYRYSRSVNSLYLAIVSVSAVISKFVKRGGRVGEKAEVVAKLLDLL